MEAIVLLESAGRPDVIAGHDPEHAAGLTQILAETATNLLGMEVDLGASRRLTRRIADVRRRGDEAEAERLQAERRRVDTRFDPATALAGTVRYLTEARRRFGRDDLAVVSYHMGIGNLETVLRAYSGRPEDSLASVVDDDDLDYVRVYFDSSPVQHREAWELLASFGDDSQSDYWRVLAAREIMRLYRESPAELERLAELHGRGPSAELHGRGPQRRARPAAARGHAALDRAGRCRAGAEATCSQALARRSGADALPGRPEARPDRRARRWRSGSVLHAQEQGVTPPFLPRGARVRLERRREAFDGNEGRVRRSVRVVVPPFRPWPATHSSLHSTGYAFDIRRRYESGAQAEAFQWTLERLEALGLIAW